MALSNEALLPFLVYFSVSLYSSSGVTIFFISVTQVPIPIEFIFLHMWKPFWPEKITMKHFGAWHLPSFHHSFPPAPPPWFFFHPLLLASTAGHTISVFSRSSINSVSIHMLESSTMRKKKYSLKFTSKEFCKLQAKIINLNILLFFTVLLILWH